MLETPEANLVAGMTWFQSTYTKRYNARHCASGHLFGGRYKAVLVEADGEGYCRAVLDYIHLNPVRAGLVRFGESGSPDLLGYRWTSLGAYAGRPSKRQAFLAAGRGVAACDLKDGPRGRVEFVARLAERAAREGAEECGLAEVEGQGLQSTLRRGWVYGGAGFKEKVLELADAVLRRRSRSPGGSYSGAEIADHGERRARAIVGAGLAEFGLAAGDLAGLPKGAWQKALVALKIRRETAVPLAWIADELAMGSTSNVSVSCAKMEAMEARVAKERRLKRALAAIDSRLSA